MKITACVFFLPFFLIKVIVGVVLSIAMYFVFSLLMAFGLKVLETFKCLINGLWKWALKYPPADL